MVSGVVMWVRNQARSSPAPVEASLHRLPIASFQVGVSCRALRIGRWKPDLRPRNRQYLLQGTELINAGRRPRSVR